MGETRVTVLRKVGGCLSTPSSTFCSNTSSTSSNKTLVVVVCSKCDVPSSAVWCCVVACDCLSGGFGFDRIYWLQYRGNDTSIQKQIDATLTISLWDDGYLFPLVVDVLLWQEAFLPEPHPGCPFVFVCERFAQCVAACVFGTCSAKS
jgi:hypothetical protein